VDPCVREQRSAVVSASKCGGSCDEVVVFPAADCCLLYHKSAAHAIWPFTLIAAGGVGLAATRDVSMGPPLPLVRD